MMSSSNYEPEQGDECSDTNLETRQLSHAVQAVPVPPPPRNAQTVPERPPTEHQNARKRRRSRAKTREKTFWNLRFQLSRESAEAYSKLLAGVSGDTTSVPAEPSDNEKSYNVTQNGIVIWTPMEKDTLYTLLDRKGKNGIKEIAAAIGTKSELEVQDHLRLLHRGLERQHLRDRHTRTVILGDVPAAAEVRGECSRVLDRYAELMRLEEQYLENVAGRKKHYDAWVIDREKAGQINEEIEEEEEEDEEQGKKGTGEDGQGTEERGEEAKEEQAESKEEDEDEEEEERIKIISYNPTIHLTASLFNMEKWTRLSERFFMNFGGPRLEDNWANIAYPGESPSLTADAFADFYALAMSVTRRLVQSSLFFAMSRIRRMRDTGHRKAQIIKTRDVKTALSVLNMKQDCSGFWPGLARRCSLDVVDYRHRKGWRSAYMDHNQVEDVLSGDVSHKTNPDGMNPSHLESRSQEHAADGVTGNNDNDCDSDVRSSPEPMVEQEQLYLGLEDEHAETVDQKKSNLEELRLWSLLGHRAPVNLDASVKPESEDDTRVPPRPTGERKTKEDLVDWRDRTFFRSEWEEYGKDIFDIYEAISEDRRKRRRIVKEPPRQPSGIASPASVSLLPNPNRNVEMDTGAQEVDFRAVKPEGEGTCEEAHSEAMDMPSNADRDSAERDQKPILSIGSEELKYNQSAFRNPYESESESESESDEDHKPHQHMIKYEPSEDEGSESMPESDDESTGTEQKANITNDNAETDFGDDDQSESMSLDTGSSDEEDRQQKQRIKQEPSEGVESESDGAETDQKSRTSHDGHSYEDESKHKTSSENTTSDNEDTKPPVQTANINRQQKQEPESEFESDADAES